MMRDTTTVPLVLPSPRCFERGAKNEPQTGSNGFSIGVGQYAEPLRIPCI